MTTALTLATMGIAIAALVVAMAAFRAVKTVFKMARYAATQSLLNDPDACAELDRLIEREPRMAEPNET